MEIRSKSWRQGEMSWTAAKPTCPKLRGKLISAKLSKHVFSVIMYELDDIWGVKTFKVEWCCSELLRIPSKFSSKLSPVEALLGSRSVCVHRRMHQQKRAKYLLEVGNTDSSLATIVYSYLWLMHSHHVFLRYQNGLAASLSTLSKIWPVINGTNCSHSRTFATVNHIHPCGTNRTTSAGVGFSPSYTGSIRLERIRFLRVH